mmetsp:Transcript_16648/g.42575  ORF Transcript_16648/g.42575 Transcript_16648/m.42575 type:complete len:324 (-) Transcript_16648:44-1015(-)
MLVELGVATATGYVVGRYRERRRNASSSSSSPSAVTLTGLKTGVSMSAWEKRQKAEHVRIAKAELGRLWTYKEGDRERVQGFFDCLRHPNWKLEKVEGPVDDTYEVWRLPGEKVNRIMGVATVPVAPNTAFEEFKNPKRVFSYFFPRIDPMFIGGDILAEPSSGRALCHAAFKMPAPFGGGSAPVASRDFIWEQRITKLNAGGVLVSAQSIPDDDARKMLPSSTQRKKRFPFEKNSAPTPPSSDVLPNLPKWKGAVRGDLQTSGYFGKEVWVTPSGSSKKQRHARVWYVVQADPKGIIPKWLVNLVSKKQAQNVVRLADMYRK